MKYVKFFVGLLLFIAPIILVTFPTPDWTIHAPIVNVARSSTFVDTTWQVHTFKWYTHDGQAEYILDVFGNLHTAGMRTTGFMIDGVIPNQSLSMFGIFTIITLWGIALYLVLQIIDNKKLNIISDIFLIGLASINLASFIMHYQLYFSPEFGLPIFSIFAGILGIVGLVFSALDLQKKTRKRRR